MAVVQADGFGVVAWWWSPCGRGRGVVVASWRRRVVGGVRPEPRLGGRRRRCPGSAVTVTVPFGSTVVAAVAMGARYVDRATAPTAATATSERSPRLAGRFDDVMMVPSCRRWAGTAEGFLDAPSLPWLPCGRLARGLHGAHRFGRRASTSRRSCDSGRHRSTIGRQRPEAGAGRGSGVGRGRAACSGGSTARPAWCSAGRSTATSSLSSSGVRSARRSGRSRPRPTAASSSPESGTCTSLDPDGSGRRAHPGHRRCGAESAQRLRVRSPRTVPRRQHPPRRSLAAGDPRLDRCRSRGACGGGRDHRVERHRLLSGGHDDVPRRQPTRGGAGVRLRPRYRVGQRSAAWCSSRAGRLTASPSTCTATCGSRSSGRRMVRCLSPSGDDPARDRRAGRRTPPARSSWARSSTGS